MGQSSNDVLKLLLGVQGVMIALMNDEDFINLKYDVDRHEGDLDTLSKRIDELKADMEVVIRISSVFEQVLGEVGTVGTQSQFAGAPPFDPVLLEKYRAFLERHKAIGGVRR